MHRDIDELPDRIVHAHFGEAAVFGLYVRLFLRAGDFARF